MDPYNDIEEFTTDQLRAEVFRREIAASQHKVLAQGLRIMIREPAAVGDLGVPTLEDKPLGGYSGAAGGASGLGTIILGVNNASHTGRNGF